MGELRVAELDVMRDAVWQFNDSAPHWRHGRFGVSATFDPFPAYGHRLDVVTETAELVARLVPPLWDVELYSADREEVGRSNGFSSTHLDGHYGNDGKWLRDAPTGLILLSGKRIPPHPAMTRYLVAHEYGHHVQYMLNQLRGSSVHDDDWIKEYAEVRGLPPVVHHGSGGRWHNSIIEVFACDFRIVVCGIETEHWPHHGIARPEEVPALAPWWEQALGELAAARAAAGAQ